MGLVYYYGRWTRGGRGTATATRVCVADNDADVPARYMREPSAYIIIITIIIRIEHHGMYVVIMGRVKKKKKKDHRLAPYATCCAARYRIHTVPARTGRSAGKYTVLLWQFFFLAFLFFFTHADVSPRVRFKPNLYNHLRGVKR